MVFFLRQHEDDLSFREYEIKRVMLVRGQLVVKDDLLKEGLEVIGYREACRACLTANQIE
jgi:hypothetical protein